MSTVGIVTGGGRGMGYACAQRVVGLVDTLLVVDRDPDSAQTACTTLAAENPGVAVESVELDITDAAGLARLAERVGELGELRAVAHAAGISPSMADWRRIFVVDLIGTALLAQALRPLAVPGTATVCFASMAPLLDPTPPDPAALAILDDPLAPDFLDRLRETLGPVLEKPGVAYGWAKRGVHLFVQQEAVRLGPSGARICSVSPGMIDTPQGRQEAAEQPSIAALVERTPLGRMGLAEEVADVVAFALSDRASFLNGTDLLVDGGVMAAVRVAGHAAR
ncbi:SDR family oxidoreductase [Nocardia macrotermitis]|uniref:Glucose 1-dehydrogenase 4 n=1 Tax=Nocardia macrotermitis TaxID=2585198 RepID=A0A7K0CZ46_9NOCA|nr:SDR family oxidoreductase [Nocardia macrotermitis]MQY18728.1 Glucose 1-dehydrogenase 4 [Nocardia macrotermitis]